MPNKALFALLLAAACVLVGCGPDERDPPSSNGGSGGAGGSGEPAHVQVLEPAENAVIARGVPVTIVWTGEAETVDIFADADGDLATDDDQTALAWQLPTSSTFTWETDHAPQGTWRIVVRTNDAVALAPGTVQVVAPLLEVANLEPAETLSYPLALVTGTAPAEIDEVAVSGGAEAARTWPAAGGTFKVLVRLAPGDNDLRLEAGGVQHRFELRYEPMENPRLVRMVYVVAADGDGSFQAPEGEPNDLESAKRRLALAGELMQTFTAEALHAQGLGRRTFRLARDENGLPEVAIFHTALTLAQARSMEGGDLWSHFNEEMGIPADEQRISVTIMSMTQWDPVQGVALAHTALGGGRLGLFGSGALHTWAQSLDELVPRFMDDRRIDTTELLDDSAFRGTYWANYATGIGATMHELGHCLSLPHPADHVGVMSRGFDQFNRTFMVREPPSAVSPGLDPVRTTDETGWDRSAAVRLRYHRWFESDDFAWEVNEAPRLTSNGTTLSFSTAAGLRHIAWNANGEVAAHEEFLDEPPAGFEIAIDELVERYAGVTSLGASAIDDDGNIGEWDLTSLLERP